MKENIITTLQTLRRYAAQKGVDASFFFHYEDSFLMRFANSAISLNTSEHLLQLGITIYEGRKRVSCQLITELHNLDEMKKEVDRTAEIVKHAQPLNYTPTIPEYEESFIDENGYDDALANISNEERLAYFNHAAAGLESEVIQLSGIFSKGTTMAAQLNTRSEHYQSFKTSDAQITLVLSHKSLKWEVIAEQSAQRKTDLNPEQVHADLAYLLERYQHDQPQQLPLGRYDIVFGPAAISAMIEKMDLTGFDGGSMKRGLSFIKEECINTQFLSKKFTLTDDPNDIRTFPFKRDFTGIERKTFPIFKKGIFKGFTWYQDDADEFGARASGHTVMHKSLVLDSGDYAVNSLEELVHQPRDNDLLYIPYLHYLNYVNFSKGLITGSSRYGALLLKQDGSVTVPYNVRITQSLQDIFGGKIAWVSTAQTVYNISGGYGVRNPTAIVVPMFIRVNDVEISHSNSSY